jgi:hypothetical protein
LLDVLTTPEVRSTWLPKQFISELFERAFHSRRLLESLLELVERNPEAAIAWVRTAHELGGKGFFRHLDPQLFERAFHPRYLLELSERNPEAALAWLQLARELGSRGRLRRFDPELFERTSHPRHLLDTLLELGEKNPEAALGWLQLAQELGGEGFLKRFDHEFFERAFSSVGLDRLLRRRPAGFAVLLRLVRILHSRPAADVLAECLTAGMKPGAGTWPVCNLPMSAIRDVQWLATIDHGHDLHAVLESLLGEGLPQENDHGDDEEPS